MDGWWEDSVSHREPSQALCDNLEGWDGGMGGLKERIYFMADSHCLKQYSSNNNKKKSQNDTMILGLQNGCCVSRH